jgi:hypothetical protein
MAYGTKWKLPQAIKTPEIILPGVINPRMPKYNGSYVKTELT